MAEMRIAPPLTVIGEVHVPFAAVNSSTPLSFLKNALAAGAERVNGVSMVSTLPAVTSMELFAAFRVILRPVAVKVLVARRPVPTLPSTEIRSTLAALPSEALELIETTPLMMSTIEPAPPKVFTPFSARVPRPSLLTPKLLPPSLTTPVKVRPWTTFESVAFLTAMNGALAVRVVPPVISRP